MVFKQKELTEKLEHCLRMMLFCMVFKRILQELSGVDSLRMMLFCMVFKLSFPNDRATDTFENDVILYGIQSHGIKIKSSSRTFGQIRRVYLSYFLFHYSSVCCTVKRNNLASKSSSSS